MNRIYLVNQSCKGITWLFGTVRLSKNRQALFNIMFRLFGFYNEPVMKTLLMLCLIILNVWCTHAQQLNPTHAGGISGGGALLTSPQSVYVSGNYAYVVSSNSSSLEILDISNPAAPVHKGSITDGTGGALLNYPSSLYVSGNYAYVASANSNALEIVDVSNPVAPVHKGSITSGAGGALLNVTISVYVSGNYAYVASYGSNALEIIDISNPAAPVHKGSITGS